MNAVTRAGLVAVGLVLAGTLPASAQVPGMPLFTNPRYGTGVRIHADFGQATEATVADRVIQGGLSLALGPVGLGANVGMLKDDFDESQTCVQNPSLGCEDQHLTASLLAQLRVAGGGSSNLSLSLFGGASTEITAADAVNCGSLATPQDQQTCNALVAQYGAGARELSLPVGVAVGLRIPLGAASLNLWGAPRYNITKYINCDSSNQAICDNSESEFRWAVGADLPILRILSIRAAYDSGKVGGQTVAFWGIGASIGLGGMR